MKENLKTTLIFLHGGPGFRDYLGFHFENLKKDFDLVFYDQLQDENITIDKLIDQLDGFVSQTHGKVILIGHSWGGVLAAEYAVRNESKINGLVIMNTGLCFKHWNDDFIEEKTRLGLLDAPFEEIFLTDDDRQIGKKFLEETWLTFSNETFDALYENYIRQFDLTEKLKSLHIPLMNIYGSNDVRFPVKVARTLKELYPAMISVELRGAGHFPFLTPSFENEICKAIRDFAK